MHHTPAGHCEDDEQLKIILLATQPRMLREMLHRALEKAPDLRLVLETDKPYQISALLKRIQADWVVTTLTEEDRLPEPVRAAIEQHPTVSVVGLSADGSHAEVQAMADESGNLQRQRYSLQDVSLAELLQILGDGG